MSSATPLMATLALSALVVSACAPSADVALGETRDFSFLLRQGPADAPPGTCWDKISTPAVIETVTEQVLVQPANVTADGRVVQPAIYRTETRQKIVTERQDSWFQTPCPDEITPDFIRTLQRALAARQLYAGPVTGAYDAGTRAAVRRFQAPRGTDSPILSLESAQALGLALVPTQG